MLTIGLLFFTFIYLGVYFFASLNKIDLNASKGYFLYDNKKKLINGASDQWIKLKNID